MIPLESLPFEAAMLDADGVVVAANTAWLAANPRTGESCVAWCDRLHGSSPELRAALLAGIQDVLTRRQGIYSQEYEGETAHWRIVLSCIPDGALAMRHCSTGDGFPVDAQKEWQARRMETMGRLVGGVAHDFANLLTLIAGYTDILLNRLGQGEPLRAELEEIGKAANRGAALTSQLLGFTRGQTLRPAPLDLNTVICDMERMLRPIIGEYVELQTDLSPGLGKVVADLAQMEQVIMNLLLNARDAMPSGGLIQVATYNAEITPSEASAKGMLPGPCVTMTISDNGRGIAPETLGHIFEPFFTTKEKGKGTGLGLSTVHSIIRQTGGCISVSSAPNAGANFTICLPQAPETAERPSARSAARPKAAGNETILLVEDEDGVRRLIGYVLSRRGFQVLQAPDAIEALRIFGEHDGEIHLVLTDMVMPRMNGRELAGRLRQLSPAIKVVFMSGYTDDVLMHTGALGPGMSFLQKPLRPEVLVSKIREALDSPPAQFNLD